jgi:competence ComEA-like helix-hairpin-helix protein
LAEQSTQPLSIEDTSLTEIEESTQKRRRIRLLIILVAIGLGCAAYFIWRTPTTTSSVAPIISQSFSTSTSIHQENTSTTDVPSGTIEVYVTGAVQHPGVYTLSSDARVYQLLQAAGGPSPDADLVALNLAQKLVDGQEIYVSKIGEIPPIVNSADTTSTTASGTTSNNTNQGQLVNINSASLNDLKQNLHLSTKSAQEIINYRQQHGPFTSVAELLQAVSKTIYDKIKNEVTI